MQEMWFWSLGGEDLLEEEIEPTPVFLPAKSHGRRSLVGYSLWGQKESDTTESLSVHNLDWRMLNTTEDRDNEGYVNRGIDQA